MKTFLGRVLETKLRRTAAVSSSTSRSASQYQTRQKHPAISFQSTRCGWSSTQPRSGGLRTALIIFSCSIAVWTQTTTTALASEKWEQQLRADWIVQEQFRNDTNNAVSPERDDAAGGCDGIKNGKMGFHTGKARQPWWEVELGSREIISKIVIWNREDEAKRASRLIVRISDGHKSKKVYQHDGTLFTVSATTNRSS